MDIIWFLAFVGTFIGYSKLRERITTLERELRSRPQPAMPASPQAVPAVHAQGTQAVPVASHTGPAMPVFTPAMPIAPRQPDASDQFIAWIKEDWLLKLGALLLLMGIGWFITYAFVNNWVSPMGRIAIGVILGALAMLLGILRMKRFKHQGELFMVTGGTTILLTLYAARSIYDFFTPTLVLACMFITAVIVAVVSVYKESNPLALSSLLMALLAPLFVVSHVPDYVGLFMYLIVVIIGTMWIVVLRSQRTLVAIALVGIAWYSTQAFREMSSISASDHMTLYVLASIAAVIFFISSVLYLSRATADYQKGDALDVLSAIAIGGFVWVWGSQALIHDLQAGALLGWAAFFIIGAMYGYGLTKRPEPIYLFGGVGAILLGVATSLQYDGHTLAIAWTLEAAVLVIGTLLITRKVQATERTSIVFLAPLAVSVSYFNFFNVPHIDDAVVLGLLSAVLLLTGWLLTLTWSDEVKRSLASPILVTLGIVYAFLATATMWSEATLTVVWTLGAVAAVVLTYALTQNKLLARSVTLSFFFPAIHSIGQMTSSTWKSGIMHADAFALLLLASAFLAVGVLLRQQQSDVMEPAKKDIDVDVVVYILSGVYYAILLWLSSPTLFGDQYAVMGTLVIYTLVGLFFYLTGRSRNHIERSVCGAATLGFVVARLLIVDVWQMELSGRIITFLLIGTLLMATAFIGRAPKTTITTT